MDNTLIESLKNPHLYSHPVTGFQVFETHISWVLLTGPYAYKIKKPVNFGFLDFSTLEKRKHCCQEEIRLNQRLAPHLYLDAIPICGSLQNPNFSGEGPLLEYAVKMKQFDQSQMLSSLLDQNKLSPEIIDGLADTIAHFHQTIPQMPNDGYYGSPEHVYDPIHHNFLAISPLLSDLNDKKELEKHETWAKKKHLELTPLFWERKKTHKIRECHGDIHLGNIALVDKRITIFDCIEFNKSYYWVDVISDLAFLWMDLQYRGLHAYANQLLNRYLEQTGDYQALPLVQYYAAYRAMVRAKIAILRLNQPNLTESEHASIYKTYQAYVALANTYAHETQGSLLIMHGLSGSGKSVFSHWLAGKLGAIRIRSDVERKRLFGLARDDDSKAKGIDIYTREASQSTFKGILEQTSQLVKKGFCVIIDATFLKISDRAPFIELAQAAGVPYHILAMQTTLDQAKTWIKNRDNDPSEATLPILESQIKGYEPLMEAEKAFTLNIGPQQQEWDTVAIKLK